MITKEDFEKIDMRIGTIIDASINVGARKKAYKLKIDLGDGKIKTSSAQITQLYTPLDLIGRQVVVDTNFEPIKISQVKSEVLVLGVDTEDGIALLSVDQKVENGEKIY